MLDSISNNKCTLPHETPQNEQYHLGSTGSLFTRAKAFAVGLKQISSLNLLHTRSQIGPSDDRLVVRSVQMVPWRLICSLEITKRDGSTIPGTGWLAGPATVVTAGHCVFRHDDGTANGWVDKIRVRIGRDGIFQKADLHSTRFSAPAKWQLEGQEARRAYDIGCIHLNERIGESLGWFAYGVLQTDLERTRDVTVIGYSRSKAGDHDKQLEHSARTVGLSRDRLFYEVDTMPGGSGSPVLLNFDDTPEPRVIAVHAHNETVTVPDVEPESNSGPAITAEGASLIARWNDATFS